MRFIAFDPFKKGDCRGMCGVRSGAEPANAIPECRSRTVSTLPRRTDPEFSNANAPGTCSVQDGESLPQETSASAPVDWIEVTHPFHPRSGHKFPRQRCFTTGNVALVRCIVEKNTLRCFPRAWTSLREIDDFERVSAGRALFRMDDLEALRALVDALLDDQQ